MHELSIAQEILNIVKNSIPSETQKLKSVKIRVGKLSGILIDSLKFCFEAIINDTEFSGASLDVIEIPIKISCAECKTDTELNEPIFICPRCNSFNVQLLAGRELEITEIEVED